MELKTLIDAVKERSDFDQAGMILAHNGVVRGTSRDGRKVSGLKVHVDHDLLATILEKNRKRPGILDIQVWINENNDLSVGDDVMYIVVGGDFRENVIAALESTLNEIKTTVTQKTEYFI